MDRHGRNECLAVHTQELFYGRAGHTPGKTCRCTKSLLVKEVAPSSDSLTQRQINNTIIGKFPVRYLPYSAHNKSADEYEDNASVYRKTARSRIKDELPVLLVIIPVACDIVCSGSDDRTGNDHEDRVIDKTFREIQFLRLLYRKENADDQRKRDQDAVPIDRNAADLERNRVHLYVYPQSGELDFFIVKHLFNPFLPSRGQINP